MLNQEDIEKLEATHKRIAHLKGKGSPPPWEIVIRKPTRAEYKQYRALSNNPNTLPDAQEQLVRKICVHPDRDALDALLEDWPGIPESCGKAITELTGIAAQEDLK